MDRGTSVIIKGELSGSEDLTLYGQMEDSVTLPDHTLTVGPHANIQAEISAKAVVIMGAVTGNVTAKERIEIRDFQKERRRRPLLDEPNPPGP